MLNRSSFWCTKSIVVVRWHPPILHGFCMDPRLLRCGRCKIMHCWIATGQGPLDRSRDSRTNVQRSGRAPKNEQIGQVCSRPFVSSFPFTSGGVSLLNVWHYMSSSVSNNKAGVVLYSCYDIKKACFRSSLGFPDPKREEEGSR